MCSYLHLLFLALQFLCWKKTDTHFNKKLNHCSCTRALESAIRAKCSDGVIAFVENVLWGRGRITVWTGMLYKKQQRMNASRVDCFQLPIINKRPLADSERFLIGLLLVVLWTGWSYHYYRRNIVAIKFRTMGDICHHVFFSITKNARPLHSLLIESPDNWNSFEIKLQPSSF